MREEHRRALIYAGALTVAVGGLAGVVARMTVLVPLDRTASTVEARIGATLVVLLGLGMGLTALAAFTAVPLYGTLSGRIRSDEVPRLVLLSLGVVGCLAVGFVGVQPFAGTIADSQTERVGGYGESAADFGATVERVGEGTAVVTFTYVDGPPLAAESVRVKADDFASVPGVDQQGPGPWHGTVSGERHRLGGRSIVPGDEVTVGVTDDCSIGLFYELAGADSILAAYSCRAS